VDGLTGRFDVVRPPAPAEFEVSDLRVSPTEAEPGESVTVSVTVSNVGEESGNYTVEVKLDGTAVASESVTLAGETSRTVSFTVSSGEEGDHRIEVEGLTASFTVSAAPAEEETYAAVYSLILIGVVIAIIAIVSLIYFQSKKPR